MNIGTFFRIQIKEAITQLTCELIGIEAGEYLIVKTPSMHSMMGNVSNLLYKENEIDVRYVYKGTVFGFKSHVLGLIVNPVRLLFIEYPKEVDAYDFRGKVCKGGQTLKAEYA